MSQLSTITGRVNIQGRNEKRETRNEKDNQMATINSSRAGHTRPPIDSPPALHRHKKAYTAATS
ncbi:hypothetical protein Vi05172_g5909 [Venturia inaequalis]|nr:hypothetical protein Vi05172_g5909 [Venturia inaequalis]